MIHDHVSPADSRGQIVSLQFDHHLHSHGQNEADRHLLDYPRLHFWYQDEWVAMLSDVEHSGTELQVHSGSNGRLWVGPFRPTCQKAG
jgi:hypothetical protein